MSAIKQVWKFEVSPATRIQIPEDAQVLSAKFQNGRICIWVLVDPDAPIVKREFEVYGTGHPIQDADDLRFIDTVLVDNGQLIYHVFERNLAR